MQKRPNIVIINPDQMRADSLGHLGNPASVTPNLDRLSEEGISFSGAFCQNPVCTPSRCSFMSGWYPHTAGHRTMNHMMREHEPVLLRQLKEAGYHVWMNQRNDLLPAQKEKFYESCCDTYFRIGGKAEQTPEKAPRDDWRGNPEGDRYYSFFRGEIPRVRDLDQIWTDAAVDFIRDYEEERPFCIYLPWMLPHPTYEICEPYFRRIDRKKLSKRVRPPENYEGKARIQKELNRLQQMQEWKEEEYDELRAVYLGMCSRVDVMTGEVIKALKESGAYENTAIFFFSDHGDYTGDYGLVEKVQNCFEDCLTNVPFIVKLPEGMQKRRGVSSELTELIDFYATAAAVAGLKDRHTHFGLSLIPYLAGETQSLRQEVFSEGGFRKGEEHCKEMGGASAPDPKGLYYPRQFLQASDEMYNGKAVMIRTKNYKYVRRLYEKDEFYDLKQDPSEVHNTIDKPEYEGVIADLKERLLFHYMDTCDAVPFDKDTRMEADFMRTVMH